MYDYYPSNSIAQQKHQELIDQAAHASLVRQQRRLNRKPNSSLNHVLVSITHLFTR